MSTTYITFSTTTLTIPAKETSTSIVSETEPVSIDKAKTIAAKASTTTNSSADSISNSTKSAQFQQLLPDSSQPSSLNTLICSLPNELIDIILGEVLAPPSLTTIPITSTWRPPTTHQVNRTLRTKARKDYFLSRTFIFQTEFGCAGGSGKKSLFEMWASEFEGRGRIVEGMEFQLVFWGGAKYGRRLVACSGVEPTEFPK